MYVPGRTARRGRRQPGAEVVRFQVNWTITGTPRARVATRGAADRAQSAESQTRVFPPDPDPDVEMGSPESSGAPAAGGGYHADVELGTGVCGVAVPGGGQAQDEVRAGAGARGRVVRRGRGRSGRGLGRGRRGGARSASPRTASSGAAGPGATGSGAGRGGPGARGRRGRVMAGGLGQVGGPPGASAAQRPVHGPGDEREHAEAGDQGDDPAPPVDIDLSSAFGLVSGTLSHASSMLRRPPATLPTRRNGAALLQVEADFGALLGRPVRDPPVNPHLPVKSPRRARIEVPW